MSLNTRIRGLQIKDADVDTLQLTDDAVTNVKLANITQGSVKVGGASDAPTDLVAKTDKQILIGDGTDITSVAVTGDITITNLGVTAIGATKVIDSMINDDVATGLAGSGLTATSGVLSVDAITDNLIEADILFEDESANCNGSTVAFSLASTPIVNSVQVFLNGMLQQVGSGKSYTLAGTTVTFATAPASDDTLVIHYLRND